MAGASVPIGIDLNSPMTWFTVIVALIVLALTLSTRRSGGRPRSGFTTSQRYEPSTRAGYAQAWAEANALFVDNPRAACRCARAIVAAVVHDCGTPPGSLALLAPRYQSADAIAADAGSSTEQLRAAFLELRAAFEAVAADDTPGRAGPSVSR